VFGEEVLALLVGALLALVVGVFTTAIGMDRDRALYPAVTIVVASYYALFAVMGASTHVLILESLVAAVFVALAAVGFRSSLWIVAAALAGHGVFDLVHDSVVANPGVPSWWPSFCLTYDVVAGGYLAWLIKRGRAGVQRSWADQKRS
jgi:hypothetical protein